MKHMLFHQDDGSTLAIPVNDSSTFTVKTWRPPVFSEQGSAPPVLVEDQTIALGGVTSVELSDGDAPVEATVLAAGGIDQLEPLTDAQARALDSEWETAPMPWEMTDA